jgi:formylglycine-generating enzyme required for sulfatase activity
LPVEKVSWDDCQEFVRKLNAKAGGGRFRLPTEAEWEYACRAGTTGPYAGTLDDMGWFDKNSGNTTHTAGQKRANAWGLFDMHGNVLEWCQDWYGVYPSGSVTDPTGSGSGVRRVSRGGGCFGDAGGCRSAFRCWNSPGFRDIILGLRLARDADGETRPVMKTEIVLNAIQTVVKDGVKVTPASISPNAPPLRRLSLLQLDENDGVLVVEQFKITKMNHFDKALVFLNQSDSATSFGGSVYICKGGRSVIIYDATGKMQRSVSISSEVRYSINFTVLPDKRMAFLDNQNDVIYFVDQNGEYLKTVAITAEPDRVFQNMHGVVVDGKLIVSENGHSEVIEVDLTTYKSSVFRSLKPLSGFGAITYADGKYYICQGGRNIYSFSVGSPDITKLATTPVGDITGIVCAKGHLYAVANGRSIKDLSLSENRQFHDGVLYGIDLKSGEVTQVRDGLDYPRNLLLPNSTDEQIISTQSSGSATSVKALQFTEPKVGEIKTVNLSDGVKLDLVWCPAGSFMMGSPESEVGREKNETQHRVTLTKGFWLGKTEVTQRQWDAVMGSNPSKFKGAELPVENVSWDDCLTFMWKLNVKLKTGGTKPGKFRLPTEAEWEYACRAGTTGPYAGDLDGMGWYSKNSGSTTHVAGQKRANAWGFYDMHGNLWEWCQDWYGAYPTGNVTDPVGMVIGADRVFRGGSWFNGSSFNRSAYRGGGVPSSSDVLFGFRVALAPVP